MYISSTGKPAQGSSPNIQGFPPKISLFTQNIEPFSEKIGLFSEYTLIEPTGWFRLMKTGR